jgi:hypothetical protein
VYRFAEFEPVARAVFEDLIFLVHIGFGCPTKFLQIIGRIGISSLERSVKYCCIESATKIQNYFQNNLLQIQVKKIRVQYKAFYLRDLSA